MKKELTIQEKFNFIQKVLNHSRVSKGKSFIEHKALQKITPPIVKKIERDYDKLKNYPFTPVMKKNPSLDILELELGRLIKNIFNL